MWTKIKLFIIHHNAPLILNFPNGGRGGVQKKVNK